MTSATDICNLALSYLGEPPLTSLESPTSKVEQLCAFQYPLMRDAVLEEVEWSFAVRRYSSSTPDLAPPNWGFQYAYTLSNEVLRVTYCSDSTQELYYNANFQWVLEDNQILCNATQIYYRTINLVTDTTKFSPMFIQTLAARLAMEMCISITENTDLLQGLTGLYAAKLKAASTMDNMQGKSQRLRVGRLRASRGGI